MILPLPLCRETVPFCFYHWRELDCAKSLSAAIKQSSYPQQLFSNLKKERKRKGWAGMRVVSQDWCRQSERRSIFPTGRPFQKWEMRPDSPRDCDDRFSSRNVPSSSLHALSCCFSEEQGGSREDILNFHALRNLRRRGPALAAATW